MDLYKMVLEDGKEYYIIDTITCEGNKYLIFAQDNNEYTIRKVWIHDNKEAITKLDAREEYDKVMVEFLEKHKGDYNEKA